RNCWYAFRDRIGPLLEVYHRQILQRAVTQGMTTARQGSLDGTSIAANASRHRLINLERLQRRLEWLSRVITADRDGRDTGPLPAWMARCSATRRRQRQRFREALEELLKEHTRNDRRPREKR